MPSPLSTTAVAGAESDAGTVMVLKMYDCDAVTVIVEAAVSCSCVLEVGATAGVLVASLLAGCVGCVGCVGCAECLGCSGCVGCADCLGCSGCPPAGLPPTLYFGIGGLEIDVLKPAGKVVCSVNEAGMGLLVAEVKLHSCFVMAVGVGLLAVLDW